MTYTKIFSAAALVALVAVPFIVLNAASERSNVDSFLRTRAALFDRLHADATGLPAGYEHVHRQSKHKLWPPNEHIRTVVGGGKLWYADSSASYDIRLTGEAAEKHANDVVMQLFDHLSSGFEGLGLTSGQSGGPSMVASARAAHFQSWRDEHHHFIVTLTAVVDADSDTAFISRFVHERFE